MTIWVDLEQKRMQSSLFGIVKGTKNISVLQLLPWIAKRAIFCFRCHRWWMVAGCPLYYYTIIFKFGCSILSCVNSYTIGSVKDAQKHQFPCCSVYPVPQRQREATSGHFEGNPLIINLHIWVHGMSRLKGRVGTPVILIKISSKMNPFSSNGTKKLCHILNKTWFITC